MTSLYARAVFFTRDAERAQRFYTEQLGFTLDWNFDEGGRPFVFQVSLLGFELIINQADEQAHGRVFLGLDEDQGEPLRRHFSEKSIRPRRVDWGRPTLLVEDPDGNELFFWLPNDDFTGFEILPPPPGTRSY